MTIMNVDLVESLLHIFVQQNMLCCKAIIRTWTKQIRSYNGYQAYVWMTSVVNEIIILDSPAGCLN